MSEIYVTAFKGVLKDGTIIAVKKLAISETDEAITSFDREVTLIGSVHHENLLRLLGCCRKGPDLLLVYEYMEMGSLHKYLFGMHDLIYLIASEFMIKC